MWQPIDTIPNGGWYEMIDIWDGYGRITDCYWNGDGWYYYEYDTGWGWSPVKISSPKFWMYVPKPPVKEDVDG